MPDQFRGPVCTAPVVVFQRRIEMAGVKCIGEIGEKYVRPSLFGCPMPPAKFVKKVLKLRRKPLPQLSQGPLQAAVRALKQELDVIALQPIYEKPTDQVRLARPGPALDNAEGMRPRRIRYGQKASLPNAPKIGRAQV